MTDDDGDDIEYFLAPTATRGSSLILRVENPDDVSSHKALADLASRAHAARHDSGARLPVVRTAEVEKWCDKHDVDLDELRAGFFHLDFDDLEEMQDFVAAFVERAA